MTTRLVLSSSMCVYWQWYSTLGSLEKMVRLVARSSDDRQASGPAVRLMVRSNLIKTMFWKDLDGKLLFLWGCLPFLHIDSIGLD